MNKATRVAASALGIYAGLLGIEHGVFEILQGNAFTNGILINAIGPNCQPEEIWHVCFPALTLLPTFQMTGILAIIVGLSVLIWAAGFTHRKHGGLVLMLLSILMIPVGGGFMPAFIGIIASAAGTRIHAPLTWWRGRSPKTLNFFSQLWPWVLVLLITWIPGSWIMGHFFGEMMLSLGGILFLCFDFALPFLIIFSALACDVQHNS